MNRIAMLILLVVSVLSFQNCSPSFLSSNQSLKIEGVDLSSSVLSRAANMRRDVTGQLIDSRQYNYAYTYGPAMMNINGQTFVYACSTGTGDNDWDWIRMTSTDFSNTAETFTLLKPKAEGSACDPSVVQANDGYYYLFYGGLIHNVQGLIYVARSGQPNGPFERFTADGNWVVDAPNARAIINPFQFTPDKDGRQDFYGAGSPSVVYKDGNFYMWYVDDSRDYPTKQVRVYLRNSVDAINWTAPVETNITVGDVKYDPATSTYVSFHIQEEFTPRARGVVQFSKDAVHFTDPVVVCEAGSCMGSGGNNPGLEGDGHGQLLSHEVNVGFGANYDLNACDLYKDDCWGKWSLYNARFSLSRALADYQSTFTVASGAGGGGGEVREPAAAPVAEAAPVAAPAQAAEPAPVAQPAPGGTFIAVEVPPTAPNEPTRIVILPAPVPEPILQPILRFWSPLTGEHFYTSSFEEGRDAGYVLEGTAFNIVVNPGVAQISLFRCNRTVETPSPTHFASLDVGCEGQRVEGRYGWLYSEQLPGSFPLYRLYNHASGDHMLSFDPNEGAEAGYRAEALLGFTR